MTKNRIKKMIQKTVFSSAIITGLLTGGIGSASAAGEDHPFLKDSNGNPIRDGSSYFLEPYESPNQIMDFAPRYGGDSLYTTGHSPKLVNRPAELDGYSSAKVYVNAQSENNWESVTFGTNYSNDNLRLISGGYYIPQTLGKKLDTDDELETTAHTTRGLESHWIIKASSEKDYFSLQNAGDAVAGKETFLSYSDPGEWLKLNQPATDSKKLWRLVKAPA
ncbi:hypothetical protein [Bacillus mycoides]|uniref:hypothetical protein n=1 Tax=Bacillus mycoides TaxID=1405 RepID=UPI00381D273A